MLILRWAGVVGLVLDIIGAGFLTYGLILSKKDAVRLGVTYWASENDEENLGLPPVQDKLKQSVNAKIGFLFLFLGFVGQIIAALPNQGASIVRMDQRLASCQIDATKLYPSGSFSTAGTPLAQDQYREYVRLCMAAQGYKKEISEKCLPGSEVGNGSCFVMQ